MKKYFDIKFDVEQNGFLKGFVLKRDVTTREALYIADKLLGFDIRELYLSGYQQDRYELDDIRKALRQDINDLLRGNCDEMYFMSQWSPGCEEDGFGLFGIFSVANYLKTKGII